MKAWIIYEYDAKELATSTVYTDYDECVADADQLDNGMIIQIEMPDDNEPTEGEDNE